MKKLLLTATTFLTLSAGVSAQVTIGSTDIPQSFSILELVSATRGLRLPHMTTDQRNNLEINKLTGEPAQKALGLQIFNTTTKCVETWNGAKWIEQCADIEAASLQTFCGSATVGDLVATGIDIKWYLDETGGTPLDDYTPLLSRTYYVSQTFNGTESKRVPVTVNICITTPPTASDQTFCSTDPHTVGNLAATGTNIKWYDASGELCNDPDALLVDGETYYASQTVDECESDKMPVTVTITDCVNPWVDIAPPYCTSIDVPPVRFAKFNLGADPSLDNPKAQMNYMANTNFSKIDASVFGGLFQWGRKWDSEHGDANSYPVSVSGTYLRYHGNSDHAASMSGFTLSNNYESDGQLKDTYDGKYMYLYDNSSNNYDWLVQNTSSPLWNSTLGMAPNRWGNGYSGNAATPEGGVLYSNQYYQNPVKTPYDPCPPGFRVPTQDEWERTGAYGCNPNWPFGNDLSVSSSGTETGKGLTWVPVVCSNTTHKCIPSTSWTEDNTSSGYAVYADNVWSSADNRYKAGSLSLHDTDAPEPLLFLPSAGYRDRNNGNILSSGLRGYYWSSTVYEKQAFCLNFNNATLSHYTRSYRAAGNSIRCVVE